MIIVDEITFATEDVDSWLTRWRAEYVPGAEARGLELLGVWRGGTSDPRRSAVLVQWRVPSVPVFWAARMSAKADHQVASFWKATDAIALARDRRVLQPVEVA